MSNPTDTNQPDHTEEVLEMVTDTNQASEDENSMRECFRCHEIKPVVGFEKPSKNHQSRYCNECRRALSRESYERRKEAILERNEAYRKLNGERINECQRLRYQKVDKSVHSARSAVAIAIKKGQLSKLPCEICATENVQFHHSEGYEPDKWLIGEWLCVTHHAAAHKAMREKQRQELKV